MIPGFGSLVLFDDVILRRKVDGTGSCQYWPEMRLWGKVFDVVPDVVKSLIKDLSGYGIRRPDPGTDGIKFSFVSGWDEGGELCQGEAAERDPPRTTLDGYSIKDSIHQSFRFSQIVSVRIDTITLNGLAFPRHQTFLQVPTLCRFRWLNSVWSELVLSDWDVKLILIARRYAMLLNLLSLQSCFYRHPFDFN